MSSLNNQIREAIQSLDTEKARNLIRQAMPSANAETYRLAAQVALNEQQRENLLKLAAQKENEIVPVPASASPMDKSTDSPIDVAKSDVTRLLASAAITQGVSFRLRVLNQYQLPYRATAPEIGVDADIIFRVCSHIQKEAKGNPWPWIIAILVSLITGPFAAILFPAIIFIWAWTANNRNEQLREKYLKYFRPGSYSPEQIKSVFNKADLPANLPDLKQNIIVYSGFNPFVGAGVFLGGWSLPVDLGPYEDEMSSKIITPEEFQLSELYRSVENHLEGLQIGRMEMRDYIYAYGADISNRTEILAHRVANPQKVTDPAILGKYMNSNDWAIRYYKWILIYDWDGNIVISFFLRFSRQGARNLFIEFNQYLLPPLQERFYEADRLYEPTWEKAQRLARQRQKNALSAQSLVQKLYSRHAKKVLDEIRKEVEGNPRFNYGVAQTVREYAATSSYTRFFQLMDKEMYVKIYEKEIFRAISNFLREKYVNTEDFETRRSYIVNQGIMVQGNITGEGIAIGNNAQASNQNGNPLAKAIKQIRNDE